MAAQPIQPGKPLNPQPTGPLVAEQSPEATPTSAPAPVPARKLWADPPLKVELIALGAVLLASLVVRLYNLGTFPDTLMPDEADFLQDAVRVIVGHGPDKGFFGLDWIGEPAFTTYLMSFFLNLFGVTPAAIRLPAAIISVLALIPFYYLLRRQINFVAALATTTLLSSGLWYLNFSRSGWNNIHICLFLLSAMLFLLMGLDGISRPTVSRRVWLYFALTGLFCALGLYGYLSGRAIMLGLIVFFPVGFMYRRKQRRRLLLAYAIVLATATFLFLPQAITISGNLARSLNRTNDVLITNTPAFKTDPVGTMWEQIVRNMRAPWDYNVNNSPRYTPQSEPQFDPITALLMGVGMVLSIVLSRFSRRMDTWLCWVMLLVAWASTQLLTSGSPDGARGVGWMPLYIYFAGLAIESLILLASGAATRHPARNAPYATLLPAGAALLTLALVTWASYANIRHYVDWQSSPQARDVRQPYVDLAEFPDWSRLIVDHARAGLGIFNIGQWRSERARLEQETAAALRATSTPQSSNDSDPVQSTPTPALTPRSTVVSQASTPSEPAALRPLLVLGAGGKIPGKPRYAAVDRSGNLYISTEQDSKVHKYDSTGKELTAWEMTNVSGKPYDEALPIAVGGNHLYALELISANENEHSDLISYTLEGKPEGRTHVCHCHYARGLTANADGSFWLADTGYSILHKSGPKGEDVATLGEPGSAIGQFTEPTNVWQAPDGTVYVADVGNKRIQAFDKDLHPSAVWLIGASPPRDGNRVAGDDQGNILVTQHDDKAVVMYSPDGKEIKRWSYSPAGTALAPSGITYLGDDRFLVLFPHDNVVIVFSTVATRS